MPMLRDISIFWSMFHVIVIFLMLFRSRDGGQFILMFVSRLIVFPVLEVLIYKYIRAFYLNLQRIIKKGWGAYAGMTVVYYVLLLALFEFPVRITERPEYNTCLHSCSGFNGAQLRNHFYVASSAI